MTITFIKHSKITILVFFFTIYLINNIHILATHLCTEASHHENNLWYLENYLIACSYHVGYRKHLGMTSMTWMIRIC